VFGIASTARTKLIDNMKDSMIVLTTSSQIIDINPSAQLFFNLPSTQILGKSIEQLLPDWQHMLAKAQESGETEVELTVTQPSHNN
jgi:PAS domain S-box-containing protein